MLCIVCIYLTIVFNYIILIFIFLLILRFLPLLSPPNSNILIQAFTTIDRWPKKKKNLWTMKSRFGDRYGHMLLVIGACHCFCHDHCFYLRMHALTCHFLKIYVPYCFDKSYISVCVCVCPPEYNLPVFFFFCFIIINIFLVSIY